MPRVVIGTRGSALARWQSAHVAAALRGLHPELEVEERILRTEGDEMQSEPASVTGLGATGVFVRRIEQALAAEEVDLAVHSLKDMPTEQPDGLAITAVLERHDPRDALLSREGWSPEELPPGTVVGTGSFRRRCQILHHRPDVEVVPIRGNVDTRVRKLLDGEVGALVLAVAGLERLGVDSVPIRPLDPKWCVPAVGQGAIAIETRQDDVKTSEFVGALNHAATSARINAERAFLRRLGGGCLAPATAHACVSGDQLSIEALVGEPDGKALLVEREVGLLSDAEVIGARLASRLLVAGAARILSDARLAPTREHDAD